MLKRLKSAVAYCLITSFAMLSLTQPAHATLISTQQVMAENAPAADRAKLEAALARPDVQAQLEKLGISQADAQSRVASLTDAEVLALNERIDQLPAGAGIVGALVLIFVILLVTDILGFTKVYPFTKPIGSR